MPRFNYKKHINAFEGFESDIEDDFDQYDKACEERGEIEREEKE
jgi:hypothetical protein